MAEVQGGTHRSAAPVEAWGRGIRKRNQREPEMGTVRGRVNPPRTGNYNESGVGHRVVGLLGGNWPLALRDLAPEDVANLRQAEEMGEDQW